ncbi:MAG: hydroxyacylglutathione hydrolase [Rhodoferax sp.]|nr:hydroxyacylglutathione hydrolase [Rhodoferax sp.]OIP24425.1 MAG: hydroxyacylglutathione hydrolase [Comamonadaceae bacterium CG2_30_60_41]PIW07095.1 MAG: hydroxyacylglutathione hydrolase [Comamonadaceae bacterium CG17_big_fil_post_rev_8_21_14_2_50_60_13]PIY25393.1 MAG: hydroxyacylglutathione hydrolase [Comamonadaceae bacterium CG_4_10_14_3_um_filter_60_75]PJC12090.1 MAG: hydroxyacylglutathione hydrolase [Comamonadaceae bacterium CG_4_9_14_0_8_um_filter_60_18]
MTLIPLPAFNDNYIWMLHDGVRALVVDPGDATVILSTLEQLDVGLDGILITHHHGDHTGGVDALRNATGARVFGPLLERVPEPLVRLTNGDYVDLLGLHFEVMDTPGHTAGHVAFFAQPPNQSPLLFCGDTLFSAGCGRLFEGTPAQMLDSLTRLAALPDDTRVCCAHEYTASGLVFARAVEPDNQALVSYQTQVHILRAQGLPSLPSTIGQEKLINPFLRTHVPAVIAAAQRSEPMAREPVDVFAALRTWKNQF